MDHWFFKVPKSSSALARSRNFYTQSSAYSNLTHAEIKANPNSWCQEIRKLLGHQEIRESARKSPGKYLNSAGNLAYLRLRCSGEPQEEKKITNFFPFSFFSGNPRKKSRF
jgi:hypothetical protein